MKQSDLIISIIVCHSMNRLLKNFEPHERDNNFDLVLARIKKFLKQRERTNTRDFIFATEFERVFWTKVTDSYTKETPIFAINVASIMYEYYPVPLKRYANLSEKIMMKLAGIHTRTDWDNKEMFEIEKNDGSFANTFVNLLEPYSGVGLRKSLFAGKLTTLKNNLIIEGKKVKDGF